jgi:type I restriction enzyme S subunit
MREARLGDVVASMKNGMYKPASEYADDGMPCLRMYNIEAGSIVWRDIKRMKVSQQEYADYGLLEGDLLVNRVNSRELVGKAAVIPGSLEPSVFESKNIRVRLDTSKALPKFINYQLFARGSKHFANNAQQVVGMASISQGQLSDFPIVLTDVDEQRRIVAEIEKQFSRLDEAVANLQRVKANLKRYKAAILKAAVEGRLVETEASLAHREGRSYETGEQLLQRILEERRTKWTGRGKFSEPEAPAVAKTLPIPDGWCRSAIPQLATIASGNTPAGILDLVKPAGDVPWFKVGDMNHEKNKQLMAHADAWLNHQQVEKLGLRVFQRQTVIFPKRGGAIATNKKRLLGSCGTCDLNVMGLTPFDEIAPYFFLWFDSIDLAKLSDGSNIPQINNKDIVPLIVPLPPLAEQVRIVAEVDRHLSIIREVEAEVDTNLQRSESLRQVTLAKKFVVGGN